MRLARRAVNYDKLVWPPLLKESSDLGWECYVACRSSHSLALVVSDMLMMLCSRVSEDLVGGGKMSLISRKIG